MRRPIVNALALVVAAIIAACVAELGQVAEHGEVVPCRGAGGQGACPAGTPAHEWQPGGPRLPRATAIAYACPPTLRDVLANPSYCLSASDGGTFDHVGLCFREIPTRAPWGGHQCCYGAAGTTVDAANPEQIYDNCTGTYDRISPASARCGGRGAGRLACRWAFTRIAGHCRDDVTPWCDHAREPGRCVAEARREADCAADDETACNRLDGCRWQAARYCWPDVPDACTGGPDFERACSPVATTNCYCTDRFNLLRRDVLDALPVDEMGLEPETCDAEGCPDGACSPFVCGDGRCDPEEQPPDLGAALAGEAPYCSLDCPLCGDFICDADRESVTICPEDCEHAEASP